MLPSDIILNTIFLRGLRHIRPNISMILVYLPFPPLYQSQSQGHVSLLSNISLGARRPSLTPPRPPHTASQGSQSPGVTKYIRM